MFAPSLFFSPDSAADFKRYQIILMAVAFIPASAAIVAVLRSSREPAPSLGLDRTNIPLCLGLALLATILFFFPIWALGIGWHNALKYSGVQPEAQETVKAIVEEKDPVVKTTSSVLAATVVPFAEELVFRGILYVFLRQAFMQLFALRRPSDKPPSVAARRFAIALALVVSSAMFASVHHFPHDTAPIFAIGFALACIYERTKSLYYPIAFHCMFNGSSVILMNA